MSTGLDVIVIDDEPDVCQTISSIISRFYAWGEVIVFSDVDEAIDYCLNREVGIAVFVVDVYLGGKSGFFFLDAIEEKFSTAHEDTIIITGKASDDIVNMCIASNVGYLLEKPIKPFALQLAIRAIVGKYLKFAKKLLQDSSFAEDVSKFEGAFRE
ncbi:MAG: response regulator [Deltaproteobacteria bacterium]|nr:response regulator [Deltaproteobacteria bacterium]